MLLLTRAASRFFSIRTSHQPIHSLAIIGGGAGLSFLLSALKSTYKLKNQSLKITIFEPQHLGTGHAFHPESPMDFKTNTPSAEIHGFHLWWADQSIQPQQKWPGDEPVPRALVGRYLQNKLNQILDNPGPLDIIHIPKKVMDFHAPNQGGLQNIMHLVTQDGMQYSAHAYVIATGQIGTHKELPGIPPARVVNSIYPFIKDDSPLTRALTPLLHDKTKKPKIMIIGTGPSGIEGARYLLNHFNARIHLTLVGHMDDIPREVALHDDVTVLERNVFEKIANDEKYSGIDLFVNAMGLNRDPRGGLMESIMPHSSLNSMGGHHSNLTLLRGHIPMKIKGFRPIIREGHLGELCVGNGFVYGSVAIGSDARLAYFPDMARQLAAEIAQGIQPMPAFKPTIPADFTLSPVSINGYQSGGYYLESLTGDKNEQHFQMLRGFTANFLLQRLLIPEQVPAAICAQSENGDTSYLVNKRVDNKKFLARNVEELLGLTDPKLKIEGLRHLFTLNSEGKTIIQLQNGHVIPVTQRIRTKLIWSLLAGSQALDESLVYMVLFPYDLIENKLPPSLIERANPPSHVAIPALQGTIRHGLLPAEEVIGQRNKLAYERAFRNKEDPSPLAMPLALVQSLSRKQSERRILVRMSAYQDMTSYDFVSGSVDIFDFFINETHPEYKALAQQASKSFYDRVDISLRTFTILRLREWSIAVGVQSAIDYLNEYQELCRKNGIPQVCIKEELLNIALYQYESLENPYLDRNIQICAYEMFQAIEGLRNCEPYRLRAVRTEITSLPENERNKPLYELSDIIYEDVKRKQYIEVAMNKISEIEVIPNKIDSKIKTSNRVSI